MNKKLQIISICSITLLGFSISSQVPISANNKNLPNTSALVNHYSRNSLQHTTESKQKIARIVLNQQRDAIYQHKSHIQEEMPTGLSKLNQQYYQQLVTRNDILMNQERYFAQKRQKEYYPEIAINARDLGGYTTINHKYRIKLDKLIRSSNLHNLTPQGAKFLKNQLHVNNIIDLRDNSQINNQPDADEDLHDYIMYNPTNTHLNVLFHHDSVYNAREAKKTRTDARRYGTEYQYKNIYSTNKQAKHAYNRALHQILRDKNGTVLYHCIEGRDRTGITSILLLSALHVPRTTITKDYLLTNYYIPEKLFTDQLNNINTFYGTVHDEYGSINNYLSSIGIYSKQRTELQQRYLEPINTKNKSIIKNIKHKNKKSIITKHKKISHKHVNDKRLKKIIKHFKKGKFSKLLNRLTW